MSIATVSNVSEVSSLIEATFENEIERLRFRPPMAKDGAEVQHFGLWYGSDCLRIPVKEGYTPHTRDDVAALTESVLIGLDASGYVVDARWTGQGHSVLIRPSGDYQREIRALDGVGLFGRIDGTVGRPFTFEVGLYRKVCSNGMFGFRTQAKVKIRHTLSLRSRMDELISSVRTTRGEYETIVARMRQLSETRANVADFLGQMYPDAPTQAGKAKTQHENMISRILSRLHREGHATGSPIDGQGLNSTSDLWLLVNSITGYVQHDKTRHGMVDADTRLDLAILDSDGDIARAWSIADSMAS